MCGPMTEKVLESGSYFMLLVDDYTIIPWVCFLKKKSEAFKHFVIFIEMVENETDLKITTLRSDNSGEFTSNKLWSYC